MASDPSDVRVDMAAGTNGRAAGSNGSGDGYGDEIKAVGHAERFRQTVDPSQSRQESVTANSSPWQVAGRRRMGSGYSVEDAFKPKDYKMEKIELSKRSGPEELPPDMWQRVKNFFYNDYYVPREAIRSEITAGLIVGLAVVPEAIAFALVVGIKPQWGVDTTLITTFVVGVFGGRPGLCNGASGAVAVVIKDVVEQHGVEYMGYTVILAGLFCCLFGVLRLANYMTLVSSSVMIGFVNALAIIIGCAQVKAFKADLKLSGADAPSGRRSSFDIFVDGKEWVGGAEAAWMMLEVVTCMLTMILLPLIKHEKLKWIHYCPSSLIGLLLATFVEHAIVRPAGFETRTIGDLGEMKGELPRSLWNRGYAIPPLNADTLAKILPTAATLAAVALIEQMMTLQLVDQMTKTVGQANREGVGLGLGNIVAGLIGGMGGNAMIGQSVICIKSGGFRRVSNISTGFTVLLITVALFKVVNLMPAAAFVGMMWMICYYTFEWNTFRLIFHAIHNDGMRERFNRHYKIERSDVLVVIVVTVVTLFSNLAMAVACGLALNLIAYAVKSGDSVRLKAKILLTPHDTSSGGDSRADVRKAPQLDAVSAPSLPDSAAGATEEEEAGASGPGAGEGGEHGSGDAMGEGEDRKVMTMVYEIEGPLFFGSVKKFLGFFDQDGDPEHIEIHCPRLSIMDYSATEALCKISDEYKEKGKKVHLRFLADEHLRYLQKAKDLTAEKLTVLEVRQSIAQEASELEHWRGDHVNILSHRDPMHA